MNSPSENSNRRPYFVVMLVLGVAVTLLSIFLGNSSLLILGLLLALVGALGWLSNRQ